VSAVSDAALVQKGYLVRATRRTGCSSGRFDCEEADPISARPALAVLAAKSTRLRETRMPRFLDDSAPGASRRLSESFSLAGFPLLICRIQIGRAALPQDFSLGKPVSTVIGPTNIGRKQGEAQPSPISR
jgi:hypothetical protein